jgi:chlorite dismutase
VEQVSRLLSHFAFFSFEIPFFQLESGKRRQLIRDWLNALRQVSQVELYQVYPAQVGADFMLWTSLEANDPTTPGRFFASFARAGNSLRSFVVPRQVYWGLTRPSQYTKTRSSQEIDPFAPHRKPYLVIYPFVKTTEWYLMSREARQGMMNEHIRIGKQYPQIEQLLLYSSGLQDQEFIVVYETEDLSLFSELVQELRGSEARRYTLRDTPLYTVMHHPEEEILSLWAW